MSPPASLRTPALVVLAACLALPCCGLLKDEDKPLLAPEVKQTSVEAIAVPLQAAFIQDKVKGALEALRHADPLLDQAASLLETGAEILGNSTAGEERKRAPAADKTAQSAFVKAFLVVSIAELFDKTWFMGLLLAVKNGWRTTLAGSYSALLLHTVLSALLGVGFAKLAPVYVLHFITAAIFFIFAGLYSWDWYNADPDTDVIAAGKEDAEEIVGGGADPKEVEKMDFMSRITVKMSSFTDIAVFKCFIAVFVAEWGDRTQFSMIGLHSSLPVVPVFVGSAVAFLLLTISAICVAYFISKQKLNERIVHGVAAASFTIFAILALVDGLNGLAKSRLPVIQAAA